MCATGAKQHGFTLAEVAVVVLIVGLLLGGLLGTYSTQIELSRTAETRKTLETARDALVGFAAANGRLPCPATATSNGVEVGTAGVAGVGGVCQVGTVAGGGQPGLGFVPAATLALTPTDSQGYLIDSWGSRIRYAVTNTIAPFIVTPGCPAGATPDFTTQGAIRNQLIDGCTTTPAPDLRICTTATNPVMTGTGMSTAACAVGPPTTALTNNAVAVIFSVGKNGVIGGTGGTGGDESKNLDNDRVFISHDPRPAGATGGEFDDVVIWLSPSILYNRILSGGL
jgi:prepilin-type N-terminal cleavage/methylation domain-containing protein